MYLTKAKQTLINKYNCILILCTAIIFYFISFFSIVSYASEQNVTQNQEFLATEQNSFEELKKSYFNDGTEYYYKREGRPDPFMPFISEEIVQAEKNKEELTGMRRFEPGQLTLVGIVLVRGKHIAMVEDSVGKGYILHVGTEIGKNGIVEDIEPNKVLIKQLSHTNNNNEKIYKPIEMMPMIY